MERFAEDVLNDRGGATLARLVSDRKYGDVRIEAEATLSPTEARALAALLVKHADRAEGK